MATGRVPTTANSPLTAKGDLFGYSTTQARVAVGNDGETLVADSSQSVGLRYQATKSTQNAIINGGMDIWQRGTSFTSTNVYSTDRWFTFTAGSAATWSRQSGSGEFQYVMRVARDSGSTNTGRRDIWYNSAIEEATQFAGKTVTLSFYAKAGANYSAASSALNLTLYSGTGSTDVNRVNAAYTGDATVVNNQAFTLTTSLTRFSVTFTFGSTVTQFGFGFQFTPVGTAGANDFFEITGVQLEVGSVPTTFKRSGGTLAGELAACQRYYYRIKPEATNSPYGIGNTFSTTVTTPVLHLPVVLRRQPDIETSGTAGHYAIQQGGGSQTCNAVPTINQTGLQVIQLQANVASGLTAGQVAQFYSLSTSGYIGFSAEL
jgi:hypothetical protein